MIRKIALILVFATFFSLFGLPVSAEWNYSHDVVNFIDAAEYSFYRNSLSSLSGSFSSPYMSSVSMSNKHIIQWKFSNTIPLSSLHIAIYAYTQPSAVSLTFANNLNAPVSLTFDYSIPVNNGYSLYYFSGSPGSSNGLVRDVVTVIIDMPGIYTRALGINSFIGYTDTIIPIDYVDEYRHTRIYEPSPDAGATNAFIWEELETGSSYVIDAWFRDQLWWAEGIMYKAPSRLDSVYEFELDYDILSSAFLNFDILVGLDPDDTPFSVGVNLTDEYGAIVYGSPSFTYEYSDNVNNYLDTSYGSFTIRNLSVSVDLSGYDLSGLRLQVSISSPYVISSGVEELSYGYINLNFIAVSVPTTDRPWYAGIVDFFKGILGSFMDIVNGLVDWVVDLYNACIDFFANLLSTLNDYFLYFVDWGEQVIASLTGTEEDQAEAEQFEQESQKSQQDLTDLSGKMEAVERPDIDNINISVDTYIPSQGVNALTAPFQAFFSNSYIFKILIVSFTMALVSYVFFGKR